MQRIRSYEDVDYRRFWEGEEKRLLHDTETWFFEALLPKAGNLAVDVGCGYGRFAPLLRRRFRRVALVDYSMSLLREAVREHGDGGGNVAFIAADAVRLPLVDGCADACLAVRVVHHVEHVDALFAEMFRVLASGGRFAYNYTSRRNAADILRWALGKNVPPPFVHEHAEVAPMRFHTHPAYIRDLLGRNSFHRIVTRRAGYLHKAFAHLPAALRPTRAVMEMLYRTAGLSGLLPLVYESAEAQKNSAPPANDSWSAVFACPACRTRTLARKEERFACGACGRTYPVRDGIIDFRLHGEASLEDVPDERRR